jgi:hypothetical protein
VGAVRAWSRREALLAQIRRHRRRRALVGLLEAWPVWLCFGLAMCLVSFLSYQTGHLDGGAAAMLYCSRVQP